MSLALTLKQKAMLLKNYNKKDVTQNNMVKASDTKLQCLMIHIAQNNEKVSHSKLPDDKTTQTILHSVLWVIKISNPLQFLSYSNNISRLYQYFFSSHVDQKSSMLEFGKIAAMSTL